MAADLWRDDRGSATVQTVLVTPLLVAVGLFIVLCGRLVGVQLDIDEAAHATARAASLARTAPLAVRDATATAREALAGRVSCPNLEVSVDTNAFRPGGTVTVTLTCSVPLRDLSLLAVPGTREISARASSPIDVFRGNAFGATEGSSERHRSGGGLG